MASLDYTISVTGDCTSTGQGAISLFVTGGTPPYSVEWITPYVASFVDTVEPVVITNLVADTYIARVNDSTLPNNIEFYINIPVSSGVCGSILSVTNASCGIDNGTVIASSNSDLSTTQFNLYDTGDNFITSAITNTSQIEFLGLSAGTYYFTVFDVGGCSAKTQNFIVENSPSFDYGLYIVPNASCGSTPIGKIFITGLTGTPPFEYLWSNSQTGDTITGLTSGNYSVQVIDGNGCLVSKPAVIFDVEPVGFGAFSATSPTCFTNNGAITLIITGGTEPYFYSASTGEFVVSYSKQFTISNLYAGQYTFLVKDAALCSFEESVDIASPTGINAVTVNSQNSTCSSENGNIQVVVDGGTAPFTYSLISSGGTQNVSNEMSTYTFTGLSSGTYSVAVQDSNGCGFLEEVTIVASNKFTTTIQQTGTTCNLNNGAISVIVSTGFTSPLDFSLDGVEVITDTSLSAVTFTNVNAGQHTISVTDATGCVQSQHVVVGFSEPLTFSLYSTSCVDGNNGIITAFISSGTPPFTFDWSDNIPYNPQYITVSGLSADTYSVTITDSFGCTIFRDVEITCNQLYTSYQTYVMGEEIFNVESPTKCGILQMFNEGFVDLTTGNTSCSLVSAEFTAIVSVNPLGLTTSQVFYTSNSLQDVPSDDAWYLVVKTLLYTVPGVGNVSIDSDNNRIIIQTIADSSILNGQEILIEMRINYDITCLS